MNFATTFLVLLASLSPAEAADRGLSELTIILGLKAAGRLSGFNQPANCRTDVGQFTARGTEANRQSRRNSDEFCREVDDACVREFGNKYCVGPDEEQKARSRNFLNHVSQVRARLNALVASPAMHETCCGSNADCIRNFKRTNVDIRHTVPKGQHHDLFDGATCTIQLSWKTLGQCYSIECVEEILYHELGHACHDAWEATLPETDRFPASRSCADRPIPRWSAYEARFGREHVECVRNEVGRQIRKTPLKDFCGDHWVNEAFASTIFAGHMTRHLHHQRICGAKYEDSLHPAMRPLISCMATR